MVCCYVCDRTTIGEHSIFSQTTETVPTHDPATIDVILSRDANFTNRRAEHTYILRNDLNALSQGLVAIFQACKNRWGDKQHAAYLEEEMASIVKGYSFEQTPEDIFTALTAA